MYIAFHVIYYACQDSNKRKKDGSTSCSLRKNRRSSIAGEGEEDKGGKTSRQLRKQAARKPANSSFNEDVEDLEGTNLNLLLDHGMFYASNSFFDYAKNRRILWGWSKECETTQDDYEKGWAGLQVFYLHVGYFLLIISAPSMLKIVLGLYYHHKVIYIF